MQGCRLFTSHYQFVVTDDCDFVLAETDNWTAERTARGWAGSRHFRLVGTEADSNDHWIELDYPSYDPRSEGWERLLAMPFTCRTGELIIMSVLGTIGLSAEISKGDYTLFVGSQSLGTDQLSAGDTRELSDRELANERQFEWHRVMLVPKRRSALGSLTSLFPAMGRH